VVVRIVIEARQKQRYEIHQLTPVDLAMLASIERNSDITRLTIKGLT
jgi:hypothetical protein